MGNSNFCGYETIVQTLVLIEIFMKEFEELKTCKQYGAISSHRLCSWTQNSISVFEPLIKSKLSTATRSIPSTLAFIQFGWTHRIKEINKRFKGFVEHTEKYLLVILRYSTYLHSRFCPLAGVPTLKWKNFWSLSRLLSCVTLIPEQVELAPLVSSRYVPIDAFMALSQTLASTPLNGRSAPKSPTPRPLMLTETKYNTNNFTALFTPTVLLI